ncbi:hypothetical protein H5410_050225 [Solanum commersonii]|uniref:DUF7588 domain-containing protein n=1 Tax=Solanum commersonii TaxID=4109 RepID=A0A9J5WXC3_SOLCO|nr:hypothetical protein H5410_050225 [Solanum commersonii]
MNKDVYFNTQPNLQLSLTDNNILDALTLNVKTHGYNYALGSELISLSYRIYFKLLSTLNPRCKLYDTSAQTILVETNFARSKVTTRRPIKWEEINFPTTWTLDSIIPPYQMADAVTNSEYSHITRNPDDFSPGSLARKYIQNEFLSDKWNQFKTWFFDTYSAYDLNNISQEFYETCVLHNQIMSFVHWFITTYLPLFINVLERSYKDGTANIIKVVYPPQSSFVLPNNTGIIFTAFQKFVEEDVAAVSINEINNLISQNNYLGLYVKVLGEHIGSLDKKLDELTALVIQIKNNVKTFNKASTSKTKAEVDLIMATPVQRPTKIFDSDLFFEFGC